jgi:NDP-sugar pyrophosphorylase family protein
MRLSGWRDNTSGAVIGEKTTDFVFALGFSTIHIIEPGIFELIDESGPFSIIDLYLRLMYTRPILGFRHDDSDWIEFGRADMLEKLAASREFYRLSMKI